MAPIEQHTHATARTILNVRAIAQFSRFGYSAAAPLHHCDVRVLRLGPAGFLLLMSGQDATALALRGLDTQQPLQCRGDIV